MFGRCWRGCADDFGGECTESGVCGDWERKHHAAHFRACVNCRFWVVEGLG